MLIPKKHLFKIIYFGFIYILLSCQLNAQTYKPFDLDKEFPNYLGEGVDFANEAKVDARVRLIEKCLQSVMNRLLIPHVVNKEFRIDSFFTHLTEHIESLVPPEHELTLYVGGGVVRTLLAFLYKEIYEKKHEKRTPNSIPNFPSVKSTEYLLTKLSVDKTPLPGTFVLGVGSDLDIFFTLEPRDKNLEEKIKSEARNFINSAAQTFRLREFKDPIRASLVPAGDVKVYIDQISRVVQHGGSSLDILAVKIIKALKPIEKVEFEKNTTAFPLLGKKPVQKNVWNPIAKYSYSPAIKTSIKIPSERPNIMRDLVKGYYEYWPDLTPKPEHKKTIRGLRPLLELPFLRLKDSTAIVRELKDLSEAVRRNTHALDDEDIKNYKKLVRNAYFSGARNRAYREEPGEPMNIAKEISEFVKNKLDLGGKVKRLLPEFLSDVPIIPNRPVAGKYGNEIERLLTANDGFERIFTNDGIFYHGTSFDDGLSILRNGFVISNSEQGRALYGPGVYCTKDIDTARSYGDFIIRLKLANRQGMRILNFQLIESDLLDKLRTESTIKGYKEIFDLLRNEYAIDIIINNYVIVQNLRAIKTEKDLGNFIDGIAARLNQKNLTAKPKDFISDYIAFIGLYDFGKAMGADIKSPEPLKMLLEEDFGMPSYGAGSGMRYYLAGWDGWRSIVLNEIVIAKLAEAILEGKYIEKINEIVADFPIQKPENANLITLHIALIDSEKSSLGKEKWLAKLHNFVQQFSPYNHAIRLTPAYISLVENREEKAIIGAKSLAENLILQSDDYKTDFDSGFALYNILYKNGYIHDISNTASRICSYNNTSYACLSILNLMIENNVDIEFVYKTAEKLVTSRYPEKTETGLKLFRILFDIGKGFDEAVKVAKILVEKQNQYEAQIGFKLFKDLFSKKKGIDEAIAATKSLNVNWAEMPRQLEPLLVYIIENDLADTDDRKTALIELAGNLVHTVRNSYSYSNYPIPQTHFQECGIRIFTHLFKKSLGIEEALTIALYKVLKSDERHAFKQNRTDNPMPKYGVQLFRMLYEIAPEKTIAKILEAKNYREFTWMEPKVKADLQLIMGQNF